jgi:hypothetical protein
MRSAFKNNRYDDRKEKPKRGLVLPLGYANFAGVLSGIQMIYATSGHGGWKQKPKTHV